MDKRKETALAVSSRLCLLLTANAVSSPLILSTVNMEAALSSETSVPTRPTWRPNPEDGILHNHRRDNIKY
jgi:hypothetical protein